MTMNALAVPNFNALMNPAEIGANVQQAVMAGREAGRQAAVQNALGAYAANPSSQGAYEVMRHDPNMGMRLREFQAGEEDRQREADFRQAQGAYLTGDQPPQQFRAGPAQPLPGENTELDLSFLGEPQSHRDAAFQRMLRIDPIKAMKIKSTMRDDFVDRMEMEKSLYSWAAQDLAYVDSEEAYQGFRASVAEMFGEEMQAEGQRILAQIPETYPGPEGIRQLQTRALDMEEQLTHFQRQANIDADNDRADRNTDSLISTRQQRVDIYQGNTREDNQRADREADSRARARANRGGGRGGSRRPQQAAPTATNPTTGEKIKWNGTRWVPAR